MSGKISFFFGRRASSGIDSSMVSPPVIKVAVEAMVPFTVIWLFFSAFFSADLVGQA
ncbi:hypothetical protein [Roseivirga pacifica]|uniref:hypothetical protein n=1 Tax=Roseivirga pacifica TaxID=1267423 RepID=UPI003BB1FF2E